MVANSVPTIKIPLFNSQYSYEFVKYTYKLPIAIIQRNNMIIMESYQLIQRSKKQQTILSRYNLIIGIYQELEKYQRQELIVPIESGRDFSSTISILINAREVCLKDLLWELINKLDNRLYGLKTYKGKINTTVKFYEKIRNLFSDAVFLDIDTDFIITKINECMDRHNLPIIQKDHFQSLQNDKI
jgi:hypothetical protein